MTAYSFTDRRGCTWHRVTATAAGKAYNAGRAVMTAPEGFSPVSPWGCAGVVSAAGTGATWQRQRLYADTSARQCGRRYAAWYLPDDITPADALRITADAFYSMAGR